MAKLYRTPTDKRLQTLNARARRKSRYYLEKYGTNLEAPTVSPAGLSGPSKLAAIRRLETFMSQRVKPGARGNPILSKLFSEYKRLESRVNRRNWRTIEKYADVPITPDQTIGQYSFTRYGSEEMFNFLKNTKGRRMGKSGEFAPQNKSSRSFTDDAALRKAISHLKLQAKNSTARTLWQTNKKRMESMLIGTDEEHLISKVRKLTLNQRNVLMNLTPFMSTIAFITSEKQSDRDNDVVISSAQSRAEIILEHVRKNVV